MRRRSRGAPPRALATLTAAQALGLSGAPLIVMVGGLLGAELAPVAGLSSLPLATLVIGTAVGSAPAALLMRGFGRRRGFALGAVVGMVGAVLGAVAVTRGSFIGLTLATLVVGSSLAFVMQYRFAAAELGGGVRGERSVAVVMSGGVVGGVLGPALGAAGRDLLVTPWAGSFLALAGVEAILAILLMVGLTEEDHPRSGASREGRTSVGTRLASVPTDFVLAVAAGVTAYAVMSLLMTATPVAMRASGFGVTEVALVIQAHVVAMYGPSVMAGWLVARFGAGRLMTGGLTSLGACLTVGLSAHGLGALIAQLVLLGLGWNALFLGGTVALAAAVPGEGRFRAQALNETFVFGAQAIASLGAGAVLALGGWALVNLVALAPLALMALVARRLRRAPPRQRLDPAGTLRPQ